MKRKKPKLIHARLLNTHEDMVNINLNVSLPYHLPFDTLPAYYAGGIHRPPAKVGDPGNVKHVGHEMYSIVGMFEDGRPVEPENALKGSWLEGQEVEIAGFFYEPQDCLGAHVKGGEGGGADDEFIIHAIESVNNSRPLVASIRNFTRRSDFKLPMEHSSLVARVHGWKLKIAHNLPHMHRSWGEAEVPKTIFYVGSGPSLRSNWQELLKLDYSKSSVWACNEAYSYLSKKGVPVDYFFCMDATSPERWWTGFDVGETCAVLSPFVHPDVLKAPWKKVYWYNIAGNGFYYNLVRQARPHLLEIDGAMGVGSAMIESTWFKGVSTLVLVGCDFCYDTSNGRVVRSVASILNDEEWRHLYSNHAHMLVYNHERKPTMTYIGLAKEAGAVYAAAEALWENGVQIYNCTEGGCLRPNRTSRYLMKHIEKIGRPIMEDRKLSEVVGLVNAL